MQKFADTLLSKLTYVELIFIASIGLLSLVNEEFLNGWSPLLGVWIALFMISYYMISATSHTLINSYDEAIKKKVIKTRERALVISAMAPLLIVANIYDFGFGSYIYEGSYEMKTLYLLVFLSILCVGAGLDFFSFKRKNPSVTELHFAYSLRIIITAIILGTSFFTLPAS